MEIFLISFVVIVASCAGLAAGQWFGREPIRGTCRPGESFGKCKHADTCSGFCSLRGPDKTQRERDNGH